MCGFLKVQKINRVGKTFELRGTRKLFTKLERIYSLDFPEQYGE